MAGAGVASQTVPRWAWPLPVHGVSDGTCHRPGPTSCDLPLETSLALESPGKEGQSQGSSGGRGDTGPAPVSSPLAPQPEPPVRWKRL